MKPIKVLSLFDGISCAREALDRIRIPVESYYSSEIDRYAIQISQKNYPDIIQLGDVKQLGKENPYPKELLKGVDIIIFGSPCTDLSIAKKNRQGLKGIQSGLFFEAVRIMKEIPHKYFIMENVFSMPKESRDEITKILGVEPIMLNASLVSAQQRRRLFWTNIPNVNEPKDKGILLRDIIHENRREEFDLEKQIIEGKHLNWITNPLRLKKKYTQLNGEKAVTMTTRQYSNWNGTYLSVRVGQIGKGGQGDRIYSTNGKSVSLNAMGGGRGAKTGLYAIPSDEVIAFDYYNNKVIPNNKAKTLGTNPQCTTAVAGQLLIVPEATKKGYAVAEKGDSVDFSFPTSKTRRGRVGKKAKNIMTSQNIGVVGDGYVRKLTPIEAERLQGLPDNYTKGVSNTQRYRSLGNAFNVDIVGHILSFIPNKQNYDIIERTKNK